MASCSGNVQLQSVKTSEPFSKSTNHPLDKVIRDSVGSINAFHREDAAPLLTCPPPVSDSAWLPAILAGLLQDVSQRQHQSSAQGVGKQQVTALEKWPPGEPYADQKLFTRPGKHDVQTAEGTRSSVEGENKSVGEHTDTF